MKFLNLLKIFFPSWVLFDDFQQYPTLYFRRMDDGIISDWMRPSSPLRRHLGGLFFSPQENLYFVSNSLVERLMMDPQPAIEDRPHFLLVKNMAGYYANTKRFQFKIVLGQQEIFLSKIYDSANA